MPLVSVLMTLYNEERFVRQALESLLGQTYRNIEFIICDNCSTDSTWEIVQEYAKRDPRITAHRQATNIGAVGNYKTALEKSRGEFVMPAAGHDLYLPFFVEKCVAELVRDTTVVMAYPRAEFIDVQGKTLGPCPTDLDTRGMIPISRANVVLWGLEYPYQMYGLFRRSLYDGWAFQNVFGPDFLFLVRAALIGTFAQVGEVLLYMRRNTDYGDIKAFTKKLYVNEEELDVLNRPDELYYDLMREYFREIKAHLPPGTGRHTLMASVVLAMATRHDCQRDFVRRIKGFPPPPAKSDLQSLVERFASQMEDLLLIRDDVEEVLHQQARADVLRQFSTDELVGLMSFQELWHGMVRRLRKALRRRLPSA